MKKQTITIKDIAEECGVSVATVSRVMNNVPGKYSIETEKKIQSVAEKLGYIPNVMARSLVTQKTGLVAVLIPDIHYYFYQELYTGIESYFNKYNIRPILCSTLESKEREHEYIKSMSNGLADGIIIATLNKNEDNDLLLSLNNEKLSLIHI